MNKCRSCTNICNVICAGVAQTCEWVPELHQYEHVLELYEYEQVPELLPNMYLRRRCKQQTQV